MMAGSKYSIQKIQDSYCLLFSFFFSPFVFDRIKPANDPTKCATILSTNTGDVNPQDFDLIRVQV